MVIRTGSVKETIQLGKRIGRLLRPGDVVALIGELGVGKTHMIKGLATGVGVPCSRCIVSPSFTLIHEYPGKIPFIHIDLYRLATEEEAEELGIEECWAREGVTAVEWADKIPSLLPKEFLRLTLRYLEPQDRSIHLLGEGARYERLLERFSFPEAKQRQGKQGDKRLLKKEVV